MNLTFWKTLGMVKTGAVVEEGAKGGGRNSRVNGGEFLQQQKGVSKRNKSVLILILKVFLNSA